MRTDTDTVCQSCLGIVEYDTTTTIDTLPYCEECMDNWCRVCMPDDPRGSPTECEHRPREEDEEPQAPQERLVLKFITPLRRFEDLTFAERLRVLYAFDRASLRTLMHPLFSTWPVDKQQRWARQHNNKASYICGGSLMIRRAIRDD